MTSVDGKQEVGVHPVRWDGRDEALVFHALAKEYHPTAGNRLLLEEFAPHRGLYPVWVLLPEATSETQGPEEIVSEMKLKGVRAARMFPKDQGFFLDERTCGRLFHVLERETIPLFVDLDQVELKELGGVCEQRAELPIVVTEVDWRHNRKLYPFLRDFPNLHLGIGKFQAYQGIEEFCGKFGADRVLYGSDWAYRDPRSQLGWAGYARIPFLDKKKILGGNMAGLLHLGG